MERLSLEFLSRNAVDVAQELIGKTLVRVFDNGTERRYKITATEAYCGIEDLACHASKGRTARTEVMFGEGGKIYVYLIYGIYWLVNVVVGKDNEAHAVLICGLDDIKGSGRVGKELAMDKSFYGENLMNSTRIWIEDTNNSNSKYISKKRVGIEYSGEWKERLWRFEIISG